MNDISDKEISEIYLNTINNKVFENGFIGRLEGIIKGPPPVPFKSFRDELFYRLLEGWNSERVKAGYKPLSKARLASAIKVNPFLKSDDGELEYLIKRCEEKGNYKLAHFVLFPKKK